MTDAYTLSREEVDAIRYISVEEDGIPVPDWFQPGIGIPVSGPHGFNVGGPAPWHYRVRVPMPIAWLLIKLGVIRP